MNQEFPNEIKLSFLKRLTGRQDPSFIRIIASIFAAIIVFLVTFFAGYYLNQFMLKADANVVFHPFIEDNKSLPIEITNGPKDLHNIKLQVKTCYMYKYKTYEIEKLIPYQEYPVRLVDESTVFALNKVFMSDSFICNPKTVSAGVQCYIQPYIVNGKIYVPEQECKIYRCGYCAYEMMLTSDEFSDNFSGSFPGPIEIEKYVLMVTPNNPIEVKEGDIKPFDPIGLSLFSPYDQCMFETNQNQEECKDLEAEVFLDKPMTVIISPVNKSLGNFSVTVTQIK